MVIIMVPKKPVVIRQVWERNLELEFSLIRSAVKSHSCISIDTEFPGTVIPDIKNRKFFDLNPEETYSSMKANVDASKLIQLGLTLSDHYGNLPDFGGVCFVWQFNFREFDVEKDLQNFSSIELLKRNGIDFSANKMYGVRSQDFARLFRGCFGPNCIWVTFHGGYDFGYLTKALTNSDLPRDLGIFRNLLSHYFGNSMYDVKAMMEPFRFRGGLESLAACFNLVRVAGKSHQAGSDSLLTMQLFMKQPQLNGSVLSSSHPWRSWRMLYCMNLRRAGCLMVFVRHMVNLASPVADTITIRSEEMRRFKQSNRDMS
ncbi:Poly(A)-specific ribonuclease [Heracleum sosnowskyi]|uniref:poly(A)-specific ribonuclease n=1 Tax=Heracleum sosnowskyi TaxID=360622 RepID=A0AAD8IKX0_9APIA|nr:Poly(A)-specific ribonuclease [Heracleum sosnowskyi]